MALSTAVPATLVGRAHQLAAVATALDDAVAGRGGAIVIVGEPGSGKTSLCTASLEGAEDVLVLACRGLESEVELPYSGLHELLRPIIDSASELPAHERDALFGALALADGGSSSALAVWMAVLQLLTNAAEDRPVVVLVDDLQWIDTATLAALGFVARRVAHDPMLILATSRPGDHHHQIDATLVELGSLAPDEVGQLAAGRVGRPLADSTALALHQVTGGNPLAVIETVRSLGDDLSRLGGILDDPSPATELISRGFSARLTSLPENTRRTLELLATMIDAEAATLAAAMAELDIDPEALDPAEEAGIVRRDLTSVSFAHPLIRAVAHHECTPANRRGYHRVLAGVAGDRGSRAWHAASASCVPDEAIAQELEAAAADFEQRGGHVPAAHALERAARLTPLAEERARRLFLASQSARWAARTSWGIELLEEARAGAVDPGLILEIDRARLAADIASTGGTQYARAMQVADSARGINDHTRLHLLSAAVLEGSVSGRMADCREAFALINASEQPHSARLEVALAEALFRLLSGDDPARGKAVLVRAAEDWLSSSEHLIYDELSELLVWVGEYTLADRVARYGEERSRVKGLVLFQPTCRWLHGHRRVRTGEWARAEADLHQALHLARTHGFLWTACMASVTLAVLLGSRGDPSVTELVQETEALTTANGFGFMEPFHGTALGLLDLAHGRAAAAVPHFERAQRWCARAEQQEPGVLPWPADIVEAYALAGERERAVEALEWLRERAAATDRAWAHGAVARLDGVLTADEDYGPHFEEAIRWFSQLPAPFDRARTHLWFGRRLRRSGLRTRARSELHEALRIFDQLGSPPWAEQARTELQALGDRAPAPGIEDATPNLTPQEVCVADGVTQGLTNKEIAAQLFLTPKTIEWHLRRIYRKLGIRSRVQLAQWMSDRAEPAAKPGPSPGAWDVARVPRRPTASSR